MSGVLGFWGNAYGSSSPLPLEVGKSGTDTGDTGGEGSDSGG